MIIWLASYPKSGNTWLRFFIISLLMGEKTDLNLNHLRAIINYPHSTQFDNLVSNLFDFNEIAKNWIASQKKINSDKNLRFFKTHNMLGKFRGHPFKYEDLINDTKNEFTKIANYIGSLLKIKFTEDQIDTAINLSSFEKLEKMEKEDGFSESNIGKDGNRNKFFFLGPKNNWRKILDDQVSNDIEKEFEKEMKELKYI